MLDLDIAGSSPVPKKSMAPELSGQEEAESTREDSAAVPVQPSTPPRSPEQNGHYNKRPSTGKEEGASE